MHKTSATSGVIITHNNPIGLVFRTGFAEPHLAQRALSSGLLVLHGFFVLGSIALHVHISHLQELLMY